MKKLLALTTVVTALFVCMVPAYASVMHSSHTSLQTHTFVETPKPIVYNPVEPPDFLDGVHGQAQ